MAKTNINEWSATAGDNTDVGGINIAEGCAAANANNAMREIMAQIRQAGIAVNSSYFQALVAAESWDELQPLLGIDDGVTFLAQSIPTHTPGLLFYDENTNSLTFYNNEPDVALNIGQELWIFVRNNTGSTIANGKPVYISGSSGNIATIALTDADAEASSRFVGLTTHSIENNTNGFVTISGEVRSMDTSAFVEGDKLYISSTAGGLASSSAGNGKFNAEVGVVTRAHPTTGSVMVSRHTQESTQSQTVWNTGTATTESLISPAKLDAKIDNALSNSGGIPSPTATWQSPSRSAFTWYTNNTGSSIQVIIATTSSGSVQIDNSGGTSADVAPNVGVGGSFTSITFDVQNGASYRLAASSFLSWVERR